MSESFKVTTTISVKAIQGLLCTAFEGGVGYWARIKRYDYGAVNKMEFAAGGIGNPHAFNPYCTVPTFEGCALIVEEFDETTGEGTTERRLDRDAIQRGLVLMPAHQPPRHWVNFIDENGDPETADVFLQLCLLGEIVYG